MTVNLTKGADQATARWLCGCGRTYPIDGPAYPVCECGQRCRMVDADGLPFVTSPAERLERAHQEYAARHKSWPQGLGALRECLDEPAPEGVLDPWYERWFCRTWDTLVADAAQLAWRAAELDRVEREVALAGGGEHA